MDLDNALQTYITESRELLKDMETALRSCEKSPSDPEIINALFRAAHTIKGSAGLFGLDHIAAFTNVAESLLDKVRSAELKLETDVVATLLASRDHISDLLEHAAAGCRVPSPEVHERGQEIIRRLKAHFESGAPATPSAPITTAEDTPSIYETLE